ncbi:hypothetical protein TTRE_0000779101 [Trichuris trichiura]|uniref:Uncharacterized protein n=1 Tax=Trichuris trichiura TaxID=36087 RepID=A0A077ZGE5_TRITR|nr:hypothetical protein TTRE_0000779101 [Trichuris trichiura]
MPNGPTPLVAQAEPLPALPTGFIGLGAIGESFHTLLMAVDCCEVIFETEDAAAAVLLLLLTGNTGLRWTEEEEAAAVGVASSAFVFHLFISP